MCVGRGQKGCKGCSKLFYCGVVIWLLVYCLYRLLVIICCQNKKNCGQGTFKKQIYLVYVLEIRKYGVMCQCFKCVYMLFYIKWEEIRWYRCLFIRGVQERCQVYWVIVNLRCSIYFIGNCSNFFVRVEFFFFYYHINFIILGVKLFRLEYLRDIGKVLKIRVVIFICYLVCGRWGSVGLDL